MEIDQVKLPEHLNQILNDKCISHAQVIQAITSSYTKIKAVLGQSEQMIALAKQIPKTLMDILRDEHVDTSSGESLDAIAARYDVKREDGQTDEELRVAIKKGIK